MSLPFWGHKFLMVTTGQERTSSHISTAESQPLTPGEKSLVTPPRHLHPSTALAPRGSLEGRREDSESRDVCAPHFYYFCPPAPKYWHAEGPSVDQEMLLQSPSFAEGACILVKARGCAQAPTQAHAVSWGHVLQPAQVQAPAVLVGHGLPTMATSALREMTGSESGTSLAPAPAPASSVPLPDTAPAPLSSLGALRRDMHPSTAGHHTAARLGPTTPEPSFKDQFSSAQWYLLLAVLGNNHHHVR